MIFRSKLWDMGKRFDSLAVNLVGARRGGVTWQSAKQTGLAVGVTAASVGAFFLTGGLAGGAGAAASAASWATVARTVAIVAINIAVLEGSNKATTGHWMNPVGSKGNAAMFAIAIAGGGLGGTASLMAKLGGVAKVANIAEKLSKASTEAQQLTKMGSLTQRVASFAGRAPRLASFTGNFGASMARNGEFFFVTGVGGDALGGKAPTWKSVGRQYSTGLITGGGIRALPLAGKVTSTWGREKVAAPLLGKLGGASIWGQGKAVAAGSWFTKLTPVTKIFAKTKAISTALSGIKIPASIKTYLTKEINLSPKIKVAIFGGLVTMGVVGGYSAIKYKGWDKNLSRNVLIGAGASALALFLWKKPALTVKTILSVGLATMGVVGVKEGYSVIKDKEWNNLGRNILIGAGAASVLALSIWKAPAVFRLTKSGWTTVKELSPAQKLVGGSVISGGTGFVGTLGYNKITTGKAWGENVLSNTAGMAFLPLLGWGIAKAPSLAKTINKLPVAQKLVGGSVITGGVGFVGTLGYNKITTGKAWGENVLSNTAGMALLPLFGLGTVKASQLAKFIYSPKTLLARLPMIASFLIANTNMAYSVDRNRYNNKGKLDYAPSALSIFKNVLFAPGREILGISWLPGFKKSWNETATVLSSTEATKFTDWAANKGLFGAALAFTAGFSRSWLSVVSLALPLRSILKLDETAKGFYGLAKGLSDGSIGEGVGNARLVDVGFLLGNLAGASAAFKGMGRGLVSEYNKTFGEIPLRFLKDLDKVAPEHRTMRFMKVLGDISNAQPKAILVNSAIGVALPIMGSSDGVSDPGQWSRSIKGLAYQTDTVLRGSLLISSVFKGIGLVNSLPAKYVVGASLAALPTGLGLSFSGNNTISTWGKGLMVAGAAALAFRFIKWVDKGMDRFTPAKQAAKQAAWGGGLLAGGTATYVLSSGKLANSAWGEAHAGVVNIISNLGLIAAGAGGLLLSRRFANSTNIKLANLSTRHPSFPARWGVGLLKISNAGVRTVSFALSTGTLWYGLNRGLVTPTIEYLNSKWDDKKPEFKGYAFWSKPDWKGELGYIFTSGLIISAIFKTAKIASAKYYTLSRSGGFWRGLKQGWKDFREESWNKYKNFGETWGAKIGARGTKIGARGAKIGGISSAIVGTAGDLIIKRTFGTMFFVIAPLMPVLEGFSYLSGKGLISDKNSSLENSLWNYTFAAFWVPGQSDIKYIGAHLLGPGGAWNSATNLFSKIGVLVKMFGIGYSSALFGVNPDNGFVKVDSLSAAGEKLWYWIKNPFTRTLETFDNQTLAFSAVLGILQPFAGPVLENIKFANFGRGFRAFQAGAGETFGLKGMQSWAARNNSGSLKNKVLGGAKGWINRTANMGFKGSIEEINEQNIQIMTSIPASVIGTFAMLFGYKRPQASRIQLFANEIIQEVMGDMDGAAMSSLSASSFWAAFSGGNPLGAKVIRAPGGMVNFDCNDDGTIAKFANLNIGDRISVKFSSDGFRQDFVVDTGWKEFMESQAKAREFERNFTSVSNLVDVHLHGSNPVAKRAAAIVLARKISP